MTITIRRPPVGTATFVSLTDEHVSVCIFSKVSDYFHHFLRNSELIVATVGDFMERVLLVSRVNRLPLLSRLAIFAI